MSNSIKNKTAVSFWILLTVSIFSLGLSAYALCIANSDVRGDCEMVYNYSKVIEFAGLVFTIIGAVFAFYFVIIGIDASKKKNELQKIQDTIEKINEEVSNKKEEIDTTKTSIDTIRTNIDTTKTSIDTIRTNIDTTKTSIDAIKTNIEEQQNSITEKKMEIERIESTIKEKQAVIESLSKVELNHQNTLYSELINIVNNTITDDNKRMRIVEALYLSKARLATQSKFLSKKIRIEDIRRLAGLGDKSDIDDLQRIIDDPTEDEEIKELATSIKPTIEERLKNNPK